MNLFELESEPLRATTKGLSDRAVGTPLRDLGGLGLGLLRGDLPLPAAVLKESALSHNLHWMKAFAERQGVSLAPHGKTTMAPQLFARHLQDGAWAISAATACHVRTYRSFGVQRILMANQLIGSSNIRMMLDELHADPSFELFVLVDSIEGLQALLDEMRTYPLKRPMQVLLEVGVEGGRAGVRSVEEGEILGRALRDAAPFIAFRGVETYEDVQGAKDSARATADMREMFVQTRNLLDVGVREGWFSPGEVIVSAGGSAHYDQAVAALRSLAVPSAVRVVIRSGCYVSHDSLFYAEKARHIHDRSAAMVGDHCDGLQNALEVWALVQSLPEPGRAICNLGKRDISYDMALPQPLSWCRPGASPVVRSAPSDVRVTKLYDQHAILEAGSGEMPWRVGDLVAFGVGHPCTTFDKWPLIHLVDDEYQVLGGIRTFF
jgi:D-serine dehydratase